MTAPYTVYGQKLFVFENSTTTPTVTPTTTKLTSATGSPSTSTSVPGNHRVRIRDIIPTLSSSSSSYPSLQHERRRNPANALNPTSTPTPTSTDIPTLDYNKSLQVKLILCLETTDQASDRIIPNFFPNMTINGHPYPPNNGNTTTLNNSTTTTTTTDVDSQSLRCTRITRTECAKEIELRGPDMENPYVEKCYIEFALLDSPGGGDNGNGKIAMTEIQSTGVETGGSTRQGSQNGGTIGNVIFKQLIGFIGFGKRDIISGNNERVILERRGSGPATTSESKTGARGGGGAFEEAGADSPSNTPTDSGLPDEYTKTLFEMNWFIQNSPRPDVVGQLIPLRSYVNATASIKRVKTRKKKWANDTPSSTPAITATPSTSISNRSSSTSSQLGVGTLAGIAVGAVAIVAIAALAIIFVVRRGRANSRGGDERGKGSLGRNGKGGRNGAGGYVDGEEDIMGLDVSRYNQHDNVASPGFLVSNGSGTEHNNYMRSSSPLRGNNATMAPVPAITTGFGVVDGGGSHSSLSRPGQSGQQAGQGQQQLPEDLVVTRLPSLTPQSVEAMHRMPSKLSRRLMDRDGIERMTTVNNYQNGSRASPNAQSYSGGSGTDWIGRGSFMDDAGSSVASERMSFDMYHNGAGSSGGAGSGGIEDEYEYGGVGAESPVAEPIQSEDRFRPLSYGRK
ncbi:hypothetical protein HDU76_014013 [Blyttiomyces sp. JEL0837]|nr:hypothetical protein HDU76_014013 [Blyttiomyces sp. JEL0837]